MRTPIAALRQSGQTIMNVDEYVERLMEFAVHDTIVKRGQVAWSGHSAALGADRSL